VTGELEELRARYERLKLLFEVSNVIHSTLEPREALRLVLGEAVRLMRASSGSISLVNPNTAELELETARGLPAGAEKIKLQVGQGITGWVAQHGKTARVGKVSEDPRYIMLRSNVRSELAVPLEVRGEVRGVINVDSERENAFSAEDEQLLQDLAAQAAKMIHTTWLYEQFRLKAGLFEALVHVAQTINSTVGQDEALRVITRECCQLMRGRMCSLMLLDESGEWLELRAFHGAGEEYIRRPRLSVSESFVGIVIRRQKPMHLENVQTSSRYQHTEMARRAGLVSLLSAPLAFAGKAIGTLNVYTGEPYTFSNEEIRILSALADLSAIAIEKARLYERVVNLEENLRQSEKLSAIGLLAAEIAHEIRNPLTVMKMLYHSLDLSFPAKDPRAMDARVIREKMDHLNRIVEQVLDLARDTEPRFEQVSINALIEELELLTRHKLAQQQIELERILAPSLPAVLGDRVQLGQVFLNLTLNAVEAMPGGGRLTIVTSLEANSISPDLPMLLIEFRDNGQGMSQAQQQRAFTSLLSTTKDRGSGLGLAIVSKIIEAHRGNITLLSHPGSGTTVRITLPVEA
jgi:signal transduction histidine kinase